MFRQGLRRCAPLRASAATSLVGRQQASASLSILRSIERPTATAALRTAQTGLSSLRFYSAGAATAQQTSEKTSDDITEFAKLEQLGVHPTLVKAITDGMRYTTMSDVQSKTIAPALKGVDLVAQAKTGTGKTLAFLVPMLQRMIMDDPDLSNPRYARRSADSNDIRGIVISPTRELAEQIAIEAEKLCKGTGLKVQRAVGGTSKSGMLRQTQREGCHLLVGTPGRLRDLLEDPNSRVSAPNLSAIVLDEADRMLDVGFKEELNDIIATLPDPKEQPRQTMLFSATIPNSVVGVAREWMRPDNFQFIQTVSADDKPTHDRVDQHVIACRGWANVLPTLYEVMGREINERKNNPDLPPFKAMVFLNVTAMVDVVNRSYREWFQEFRIPSNYIHSKLTQAGRTKAADNFRQADTGILFTSDVTARGMDFPDVTHVFQVGMPPDREHYIHRLGRTGRANKEGQGWLIMSRSDLQQARRHLQDIPIKPNTEFESPTYDIRSSETMPEHFSKTMQSIARINKSTLSRGYQALFGRSQNPKQLAEEMLDWYVSGLGFPRPPAMTRSTAQKLGVLGSDAIYTGPEDIYVDNEPFETSNGRGRGRGRGPRLSNAYHRGDRDMRQGLDNGNDRRFQRPRNAWDEMRQVSDDRRGGAGRGGGRASF